MKVLSLRELIRCRIESTYIISVYKNEITASYSKQYKLLYSEMDADKAAHVKELERIEWEDAMNGLIGELYRTQLYYESDVVSKWATPYGYVIEFRKEFPEEFSIEGED